MAVIDLIRNTIADHILMRGGEPTDDVYDWRAAPEVKSTLDDVGIINSVFIYPFINEDLLLPDYWCCVTWEQDGKLRSFGFNFMSDTREEKFHQFNKENNVYGH